MSLLVIYTIVGLAIISGDDEPDVWVGLFWLPLLFLYLLETMRFD